MPQRNNHDARIIELIESGRKIDEKNGIIFSAKQDLHGNNRTIGFKNKDGDYLFSFRYENKCFMAHICRAIWLKANGTVPKNLVVAHKDGNKGNNSIDNLELRKYSSKQLNPKFWSESEVQWLKDNYPIKSLSQLAEECGRSVKAVRHKIKLIDLPRKRGKNKSWSESENEQIIIMYSQKKSLKEISQKLNRTESSVRLQSSRKLGLFRSDVHLQLCFRSKNFYQALKKTLRLKTGKSKCCLCDYSKYVDLHHIDGNRKNNNVNNIASLCPNHHREVGGGEHSDKKLYCMWWRVYSDGTLTGRQDNREEISKRGECIEQKKS